MNLRALFLFHLLLSFPSIAWAQQAVGWRGDGTGVFPDAHPPTEWSTEKNVVWATKTPSRSNSQPAIAGDRLFVCSEPFTLLCLRLRDGEILWQRSNAYRDVTPPDLRSEIAKELEKAEALRDRVKAVESEIKELRKRLEASKETREIEASIEAYQEGTEI